MPHADQRSHVRELARQVARLAASPENAAIMQRWRDVNALRVPDRAPVWCRPVGAWGELLPEEALLCRDEWLRGVERHLRMILIKCDIGDDSPVDPFYPVGAAIRCDPPNVWGVDIGRHMPGRGGGAWAYDPPLVTEADFDRLQMPRFSVDHEATERELERAHELVGDVLPPQLVCSTPLCPTLGTDAADLRGLEQMTLDMPLAPELMHRLMAHIRDANLQAVDDLEATGLLTRNNVGPMTCSEPVGPETADGHITRANLWAMANSQEFDHVSPAMWDEFCLAYQRPILERYGLVGYGCCESLTHKIDGVLSIPNLRIFVCSGWTDLDRVIERVGDRHVIMWRQKASEVVFPNDPAVLARHLDDGMRRLRGCHVQVVLRELQTLAGHPDRLHVWTKLAIEAAERYSQSNTTPSSSPGVSASAL